jgi:hypothetical protein
VREGSKKKGSCNNMAEFILSCSNVSTEKLASKKHYLLICVLRTKRMHYLLSIYFDN